MPSARRIHWIPPLALGAGGLAHGASWVLLLALAERQPFALGLPALAWLHLVALGWLTLTALAVLIHVIPAFTDVQWTGQRIARASLFAFFAGAIALVAAFWSGVLSALPWAAALIAVALAAYLIPAALTLAPAFPGPRVEAAIARALAITLASLLVTVAAGTALAWALSGRAPVSLLSAGAPIHASFGLIGWLTILIMGVSARTVRPICGAGSRHAWAHIASGSLEIAGLAGITAGLLWHVPALTALGAVALLAGAIVYAADVADVLRRATVRHRPPQAFLAAGTLWLIAGLGMGTGSAFGAPWGAAAAYVVLIGWAGQLVNAHIHHIGVRLIATIARGDDDETRPGELLMTPLSWTSFVLFQLAVAAGAGALLTDTAQVLAAAALFGFAGWLTMGANIALAANRARQPQPPPDPRATISLLS
jgi:hypothetical protein